MPIKIVAGEDVEAGQWMKLGDDGLLRPCDPPQAELRTQEAIYEAARVALDEYNRWYESIHGLWADTEETVSINGVNPPDDPIYAKSPTWRDRPPLL